MVFNPIIGMLHNEKTSTYHPIVFEEKPLPGPPSDDKPIRHKSSMHHTTGFESRDDALQSAKDLAEKIECEKLSLINDLSWDGEEIPAIVGFFTEQNGEYVIAF